MFVYIQVKFKAVTHGYLDLISQPEKRKEKKNFLKMSKADLFIDLCISFLILTSLQHWKLLFVLFLLWQVQVWDTAGQERFRKSMVEHYYRNVHAVVFVYDVTKMASFQNLKTWIQECNGHRVSSSVPRVLVGNKCDLVDQIQVPSNTALKFADAHNMLLFETSAKDPKESQNVDSIFMCLACRLKAQKSLIYRDVEREDGRVRLTHQPDPKSNCPCWGPWTVKFLTLIIHNARMCLQLILVTLWQLLHDLSVLCVWFIFHVLFFNYTITKKTNPTKPVKNMFKLCIISKSKERNEKLHFAKRKLCLLSFCIVTLFYAIKPTFPIMVMQKYEYIIPSFNLCWFK